MRVGLLLVKSIWIRWCCLSIYVVLSFSCRHCTWFRIEVKFFCRKRIRTVDRWSCWCASKHIRSYEFKYLNKQTNKQTNKQKTNKKQTQTHTHKQTNKPTNQPTNKQTNNFMNICNICIYGIYIYREVVVKKNEGIHRYICISIHIYIFIKMCVCE